MPSIIPTIILATLLLLTSPAHAITPTQLKIGLVEGFTGHQASHAGDYLINTYCFCQDPAPGPTPPEAHYLQFEYYNFHQNMTFILQQRCVARLPTDLVTCIRSPAPGHAEGAALMTPGKMCRTWKYRHSKEPIFHELEDELCYETDERDKYAAYWHEYRLPERDVIRFNGQKRNLDSLGFQGGVLRGGPSVAEDKCEKLCLEQVGMPALRRDPRAQSKIVSWEWLDDMCEDCK